MHDGSSFTWYCHVVDDVIILWMEEWKWEKRHFNFVIMWLGFVGIGTFPCTVISRFRRLLPRSISHCIASLVFCLPCPQSSSTFVSRISLTNRNTSASLVPSPLWVVFAQRVVNRIRSDGHSAQRQRWLLRQSYALRFRHDYIWMTILPLKM